MGLIKKKLVVILLTGWLLDIPSVLYAAQLPTIYYYDLASHLSPDPAKRYDAYHVIACIQGLANRQAPRLFVRYWSYGNGGGDAQWLGRLTETEGLCSGWPIQNINTISELIAEFRPYIRGVVLYEPDAINGVRSTSLVATTVAACEDVIAVRKDTASGSMYNYLVNNTTGPRLPVLIDLTGKFTGNGTIWQTSTPSTGSAKCDAYIWAKEKYLDTGKCNPTILSYTLDLWGLKVGFDLAAQLSNLDYAVREKAFCFELSIWGDEFATDDPTQPMGTDLNVFKAIMNSCNVQNNYKKMIKFCGFVNWDQKYTNSGGVGGTHDPVGTEWEMVRVLTAYNAYMEGDAPDPRWVSNASLYAGLRPVLAGRHYVQNPPPTYDDMVSRGLIAANGTVPSGNYILLFMGDYDGAPWIIYNLANGLYDDSNRGQVNCTWAIDPQMSDRVAPAFDYMYRTKSVKDYFVCGDSGAGYVNPSQLYGSRSPSGYASIVPIWQEHCKKYYRMFDYSISAWLLDGWANSTTTDLSNFASFSGDGIGVDKTGLADPYYYNNQIPVKRVAAYFNESDDPANCTVINFSSGVNFAWYRTILWSPTKIKLLEQKYASSGHNHRFLDAYSFYYLMRYYLSGRNQASNYYRATWVSDTVPRILPAGQQTNVTLTVRNDGWDTWSEVGLYRLDYAVVSRGTIPTYADYDIHPRVMLPSTTAVVPGGQYMFTFTIDVPQQVGQYDVYCGLVRDGVTWFREQNNLEFKKEVSVVDNIYSVDTDGDGVSDLVEDQAGTLYWNPDDVVICGDVGHLTADISGPQGIADCYVNIFDLTTVRL